MHSRAAEIATISALAIMMTLAMGASVLRAPSERIFGMEIVGRHHDPFSVMRQFAGRIAIGVHSQPLTDIPGALLARVSNPVTAYNWLVLLTFPLSALGAYALGRHLALPPAAAVIAAIAFAFSPFHLAHAAYHPHIAQTQWMPLYFLALWRCLDAATPGAVGLLAVSIIGVTLSNFYGGLIAAVLTPVAVFAYWFCTSRYQPASTRRMAITLGSLLVFAGCGIAYAWYAAWPIFVNRAAFAYPRATLFQYSAAWWSYLVPPVEHPILGTTAGRIWTAAGARAGILEQQVSLGWGLVALGFVSTFAWLRGHRHPAALAAVPVLATIGGVALVCSLSPDITLGPFTFKGPSSVLYNVLPMFRAYARFGVVVQLMTALLAAIGAERLWRLGTRPARVACATLLLLAAAEYAVWPPALWRDVLPTTAHRWVTQQPAAIQVLDCAPLTAESASLGWLSGNRISLGTGWFDDCTEPNFVDKLSAAGYTHLLVRRGTREGRTFEARRAPKGLQLAARFSDGDVFAVATARPLVFTAKMSGFYSREYNAAWTWRWMRPEASWKIVNRSDGPVIATVEVQMGAFHGARRMRLLLDGQEVQPLIVERQPRFHQIGPLTLAPGSHELTFQAAEPPTIANDVVANGDDRPLSFAMGTWRWTARNEHP